MTRRIAVLRPEPGNAATAQRVRDAGLEPLSLPLFTVGPLEWTAPDPGMFDGLVLTSANTLRYGGNGLATLRSLPVLAVGSATAAAARDAGFRVAVTGSDDLASLLRQAPVYQRLLWLSGRERTAFAHPALATVIPVYAADVSPLNRSAVQSLAGTVALLHSTRAAIRLGGELDCHGIPRALRIAAISAKVATAAGSGWDRIAIATAPHDDALIAAARALAIDP